eukprot:3878498-Prymnesium_polylepis.1
MRQWAKRTPRQQPRRCQRRRQRLRQLIRRPTSERKEGRGRRRNDTRAAAAAYTAFCGRRGLRRAGPCGRIVACLARTMCRPHRRHASHRGVGNGTRPCIA